MNRTFKKEAHPPPTTEEYRLALAADERKDYAPMEAYFTKLRDHHLAFMAGCVIRKFSELHSLAERCIFQNSVEEARAKHRKLAARAEYHLGVIEMSQKHNYPRAVVYFASARDLDPTEQKYQDAAVESLIKKITWEKASYRAQ